MAFQLEILRAWTNGSVLSGAEDMIPPQALRAGVNVRLDRVRGLIVSRPGMQNRTSAWIEGEARPNVIMHTKLYGTVTDYGYAQVEGGDGALYRLDSTWQSPTQLLAGLPVTQRLSETNWVDGHTKPWKYFVGGGIARKDDGTTLARWGTTAPSGPPASATLAPNAQVTLGDRTGVVDYQFKVVIGDAESVTPPGTLLPVPPSSTGVMQYGGVIWRGEHNGPANSAALVDTTHNFAAGPIGVGTYVGGPGFFGAVTRVNATSLEAAAGWSGGALWQPGDQYWVAINLTQGPVQAGGPAATAKVASDNSIIDPDTNFQILGVRVGMLVWDTTTGGRGRITAITQTTNPFDTLVVGGGFGGYPNPPARNVFAGDTYVVYNDLSTADDYLTFEFEVAASARVTSLTLFFLTPESSYFPGTETCYWQTTVAGSRLTGTDAWKTVRVRKSEFHFTAGSTGWERVGMWIAHVTTDGNPGGIQIQMGALTYAGGYDLEGEYRYTCTYGTAATGEQGSPPKNADQVVQYSNLVAPVRQPVHLDLTNIAQTPGPTAPGDSIYIYRQSTLQDVAYMIASVPIDTTEYVDTIAESSVSLVRVLEPDNDPPPLDGTVIFGPGAQQRLFLIRDRNKLRFSKSWEYHKDRASNWPFQFELQIGDGSQEALNGLMVDQSIFIWSEDQTWQILGQGADAYVPLPVPLSHGLFARWCLCWGDGRIFFLAKDGIYQQQGLTQQKITGDLDPFFTGDTVHGVPPMSREPGLVARYSLVWYAHPTEPELVLLYGHDGETLPSRRLVLKKNPQTQQYSDAFFDESLPRMMRSAYADPQALTLTYGTDNSYIWQGEVSYATDDAGQAIAGRVRLPARDQGAPRVVKTYSDIVVEADTGGDPVTVQAAFNRSAEVVPAGIVTTAGDSLFRLLPLPQTSPPAQLRRHNLALDLSWSSANRVTIMQLGWHAQLEAEDLTFLDTGPLVFDSQTTLRRIHFTYDATATVTCQVTVDGAAQAPFVLPVTAGRTRYDQTISLPPALLRGKIFRLACTSATASLLYAAIGEFEPEPLPITAWDSRDIPFDTRQIVRQMLFDLEAPAAGVTATWFIDGVVRETWTVGPTVGRQRLNRVLTTGTQVAMGTVYRLTLTSPNPFQLWGLEGVTETQPLQTTFWDSRELTYDTPQILRQLLFDLDAPATCTATLYIDGVSRETFSVGLTAGRARINYVTTTGTQLVRGQVYRLTLASATLFTLWGLNGVMETQPLATTFWDSREVTFETMQLIRQIFFDLDAPAVVNVTVYVDGAVPANGTFTVGPTTGRERIDHLFNPPLHGRVFRVTMASAQPFTVWNVSMQAESEPLSTTFWDTRQVPFVLVHAIKWYALDLDAPGGTTITTEINGTVRDTRAIPATTGRQRVNVWLPAGIKGRALRATLDGATPLQLWGFTALVKPLGTSQGYQPQTLLEAIQKLEEKSLTTNEQRQSSKSFGLNEQRVSTKALITIDQQRLERPFHQVGGGQGG